MPTGPRMKGTLRGSFRRSFRQGQRRRSSLAVSQLSNFGMGSHESISAIPTGRRRSSTVGNDSRRDESPVISASEVVEVKRPFDPRRPSVYSTMANQSVWESETQWAYEEEGKGWHLCYADGDAVTLLETKKQTVCMKDFAKEIRALADTEDFLKNASVMLDEHETRLEKIIMKLSEDMLQDKGNIVTDDDTSKSVTTKTSGDKLPLGQRISNVTMAGEPDIDVLMQEVENSIFANKSGTSSGEIARQMQGLLTNSEGCFTGYDQSWICILCNLPSLSRRRLGFVRLSSPANFGRTCQECQFIIVVFAPVKEKITKTALETGRTFSTMFADMLFRHDLIEAPCVDSFRERIRTQAELLSEIHQNTNALNGKLPEDTLDEKNDNIEEGSPSFFHRMLKIPGRGLAVDFMNRLDVYLDDYRAGVVGPNTLWKLLSTTAFLYFACLLPSMAFGTLHHTITDGELGVQKAIVAQAIGGIMFAVLGGQPLVVLLTTAPLALYMKVIYIIAKELDVLFIPFYTCVGLWNAFLLMIYSLLGTCEMMKWSTRSTEEIFALFISIAFGVDAFSALKRNFDKNYNIPACAMQQEMRENWTAITASNYETTAADYGIDPKAGLCRQEVSLLFLLLLLGTVWVALWFYNFNKTPYLSPSRREMLTDYSLPLGVMIMSFLGSYVFRDVESKDAYEEAAYKNVLYGNDEDHMSIDSNFTLKFEVGELNGVAILVAFGLSIPLSLLFYIDQNVSSAMVNSPSNKLKKGPAYHLDLMVVALINAILSFFALPWVHGALPHSPLHVRCLADVEQRVEDGHAYEVIVRVRETRVSGLLSHILIGFSMFLLPYPLGYIAPAVLNGLFLYMAVSQLNNLDLWERICSIFYEKRLLPPQTYFRQVPLSKINLFTILQLAQLLVLCAVGFVPNPYAKMCFPVLIMMLMPIRHKLIPKIINEKYLKSLDYCPI